MGSSYFRKTFVSMIIGAVFLSFESKASVQMKVDVDKRVSTPISIDSMNRIAFTNDRITQVFGDEEAYTMQTDETRGQIFIKPTETNGDKAISITVSTEKGIVQDIELLPKKTSAVTIILKDDTKKYSYDSPGFAQSARFTSAGDLGSHMFGSSVGQNFSSPQSVSCDYASQLTRIIKKAASQSYDQPSSKIDIEEITVSDLKIEGINAHIQNGFKISVYKLENVKNEDINISENNFTKSSVIAIALEKNNLSPKETCLLYLVQKI